MVWPALIAAGASLLGGVISAKGQKRANEQNVQLSRDQMALQERMSNTQYERAVHDMARAGINPILSYKQGGAGTPSGQTATVGNVGAHIGQGIDKAASSAIATQKAHLETKRNAEVLKQLQSDTDLKREKIKTEKSIQNTQAGNEAAAWNQAQKLQHEASIIKLQVNSAKAQNEVDKIDYDINKNPLYKHIRLAERGATTVKKFVPWFPNPRDRYSNRRRKR